ncbi:hypothetical protein, partial [Photorhabdus sp. RM323S]|uniref:hypothetical protein n=1 Tax=Photorhabdus sp. RM323S TaxID=3342828 RepID=UPI0036DCB327
SLLIFPMLEIYLIRENKNQLPFIPHYLFSMLLLILLALDMIGFHFDSASIYDNATCLYFYRCNHVIPSN